MEDRNMDNVSRHHSEIITVPAQAPRKPSGTHFVMPYITIGLDVEIQDVLSMYLEDHPGETAVSVAKRALEQWLAAHVDTSPLPRGVREDEKTTEILIPVADSEIEFLDAKTPTRKVAA